MTEQIFKLTPRSARDARRAPFYFTPVWGTLAVLFGLGGRGVEAWIGAAGLFSIVFVPVMLYIGALRFGRTEVTPDGLRLRGMFVRRFVRWKDVATVDPHPGNRGTRIAKVRLRNGRKRRLPGFFAGAKDDEFNAQVRDLQLLVRKAIADLP
ncbi:PH domain-containing protein [Spirillospora sp. NPDC052269]